MIEEETPIGTAPLVAPSVAVAEEEVEAVDYSEMFVAEPTSPDIRPTAIQPTRTETADLLREKEANKPSFVEQVGAAVRADWIFSHIGTSGKPEGLPDNDWNAGLASDEDKESLGLNNPEMRIEHKQEIIEDSTSLIHAQNIIKKQEKQMAAEKVLSAAGGSGLAVRLLANLFDPIALGATIASDGLAAPFIYAGKFAKVGRITRAYRGGLVAGVTNAGIEATIVNDDVLRGRGHILAAFALGGILGGGIAAIRKPWMTTKDKALLNKRMKEEADDKIAVMQRELDDEVNARVTDETTPLRLQSSLDEAGNPTILPDYRALDEYGENVPTLASLRQRAGGSVAEAAESLKVKIKAAKAQLAKPSAAWDELAYAARVKSLQKELKDLQPELKAADARARDSWEYIKQNAAALKKARLAGESKGKAKDVEPEEAVTPAPAQEQQGGSAGAAAVSYVAPSPRRSILDDEAWVKANRPVATDYVGQMDMQATVSRSGTDQQAVLMQALAPETVSRRSNGVAQLPTVIEDSEITLRRALLGYHREANHAFEQWAKATNRRLPHLNIEARRDFDIAVGTARRSGRPDESPFVNQAASHMTKTFDDLGKQAKAAGVHGFEEIGDSARYTPRLISQEGFLATERLHGTARLTDFYAEAIRRGARNTEMSESEAFDSAKLLVMWQREGAYGSQRGMSTAMNPDYTSQMRAAMRASLDKDADLASRVTDKDLDAFVKGMQGVGQAQGAISRGKHRIEMDETFELQTHAGTIRMGDMYESNASAIIMNYTTQLSGAIAFARHPHLQWKSTADWENGMVSIRQTQASSKIAQKTFDKNMAILEVTRRGIMGQPIHDLTSRDAALMRLVLGFNYQRQGHKFGFAQVAEVGTMASQLGWRTMIKQMPILKSLGRDPVTGKAGMSNSVEHREMWEAVDSLAIGADLEISKPALRAADVANSGTAGLNKAEDVMNVAKYATAVGSGLLHLTKYSETLAAAGVIQRLTNNAFGGDGLNPKRLIAIGLDEPAQKKVFEQLRKHSGTYENGSSGRTMKSPNLDKWDPEARLLFETAVVRFTARAIQRNHITDLPLMMSKPLAMVALQFRNFQIAAWSKQTLHGVAMKDMVAVNGHIYGTMLGGLAYYSQTQLIALGRKDREEYLEERLNPTTWASQAFGRSGASSLISTGVDSGRNLFGRPDMFSFGRQTAMDNNIITGNPTYGTLMQLMKGAQGIAKAATMDDYDFSQKDAGHIQRLLPFANNIVLQKAYNLISSGLPEESRE